MVFNKNFSITSLTKSFVITKKCIATTFSNHTKKTNIIVLAIFIIVLFISLNIRYILIHYQSPDYLGYTSKWYDFIKTHGEFRALKYNFSDYSPSYLYLLTIATYIHFSKLIVIKGISVFFDFILAALTYLLVRMKYKDSFMPLCSAITILLAPTIFLNSALFGQVDGVIATFLLASLYFFLNRHPGLGFTFFGLAFSFKLQSIFFLPVLLFLSLQNPRILKKSPLALLTYLLTLIPSLIVGRGLSDLLKIYVNQSNEYTSLTLSAANIYQWIPDSSYNIFIKSAGIYFTIGLILSLILIVYLYTTHISKEIVIKLALFTTLLSVFFLPMMHERYFYLADIFSIIYGFYNPKYFYIPLFLQIISIITYFTALTNSTTIGLPFVALLPLFVIYIVGKDLLLSLKIDVPINK